MRIIFNTIEVKNRDLINKLFFIGNNIDNKYFFFIGDKLAVSRAVKNFGPGYYFYKSINKNDISHIKNIKKMGNIYLSLDEEGGYALNNNFYFKSFLKYRSSEENMRYIDRIFTWGSFDHNCWKKEYKVFKKKIIKTGAPRVDLWRKKIYSKIFQDEIEDLKNKYKKFLFIPSTFYSSHKDLEKAIIEDKKIKSDETLITQKDRINAKKNDFKLFLKFTLLIKKLSKHYPKKKIIIKPHPTENIDNWIKYIDINKYKNVIFDNKFNITSYIAASECVIFNSSSVGMQAVMMNKKAICFNLKKNKSFRNFPNTCVKRVNDFNALTKFINKKFYRHKDSYVNRVRERFYSNKITSSKKIMNEINKINLNEKSLKHLNLIGAKILSIKYNVIDFVRIGLSTLKKKIFGRKETYYQGYSRKLKDGINFNEIRDFFDKMNIKNKIVIMKFCNNGFLIFKKYR